MTGKFLAVAFVLFFAGALSAQDTRKIKITDLEKIISESTKPLVINFWATFCKPCMEEIPYFQKLGKKYAGQGVEILLVSLDMKDDYPAKVSNFIRKQRLELPTAWLDETNADYFCPKIANEWSGAIPATLFVNNKKSYRKFTEDSLTEAQLEAEIKAVIGN